MARNSISLEGKIYFYKDQAEVKTSASGKRYCSAQISLSAKRRPPGEGFYTNYINLVAFDEVADEMAKITSKSRVKIGGSLKLEEAPNRDIAPKISIMVDQISASPYNRDGEPYRASQAPSVKPSEALQGVIDCQGMTESDIPF